MRGVVSTALEPFLAEANKTISEAKKNGVPFTPEAVRQGINALAVYLPQGPALDFVADRVLCASGRDIAVRVYCPTVDEPLPVVIHYHGGGHMCGSVELYDPICRKVSALGHCIVIAVEYRLAPEHPYPAGIEDCEYVLAHYLDCLAGLNHNGAIYIMGDSGGGAICTTLSMRSQSDSQLKIDKQILIYPSVDYCGEHESLRENGSGFLLERSKIDWYFEQYFQGFSDVKAASPLHGKITAALPDTLIFTAGCDPLRDEGIAYAEALREAGCQVQHHQFDDMIHAYMLLDSMVSEQCDQTYQMIAEFIQR